MNDHDDIRKHLSAYCGGDLEPSLAALVEQHLAACAVCRAELDELNTALRLIRTTPEVEPPPWLTARIMARVKAEQAEKRSWLQRIFFPLYIKLPLEVMALLVVCVTGYYLTSSVENELKQPLPQQLQDVPVQSAPASKQDAPKEQRSVPTAVPPAGQHPALLQPMGQKAAQQPAPPLTRHLSEAVLPYAPPPAAAKDESSRIETMRAAPAADSYDHILKAASEKKLDSAAGASRNEAAQPAPAARSAGKLAKHALPQMTIRMNLADRAAAPDAIREALVRSGGTISDDNELQQHRIKARIPAARSDELLKRLERLGRIDERPVAPYGISDLEVTVQW